MPDKYIHIYNSFEYSNIFRKCVSQAGFAKFLIVSQYSRYVFSWHDEEWLSSRTLDDKSSSSLLFAWLPVSRLHWHLEKSQRLTGNLI